MPILDFDSQVFLAPMAGITDKPFRLLTSSFGRGNLVSEMVAVNALERFNLKTSRIADVRDEPYRVVVQLVGGEPKLFTQAAKIAEDLGAYSLDINMGCPVKKIVNNNSGAWLMRDLSRAAKIIETTVRATKLKVSVKFRKGWDHDHVNAVEFAKMCEENGASYITVHGRTRSDFYSGQADWNIIAEVKETVKIPVIANGDVYDCLSAQKIIHHTGADAVMVGRAALGAPWIISDIDRYIKTGYQPKEKDILSIKTIILRHIDLLVQYYGQQTALQLSRKYVCWYCKGLHDAKKFREKYIHINNLSVAITAIDEYFNDLLNNKQEEK